MLGLLRKSMGELSIQGSRISSRGMLPGNNTISGTASISGLTGNQLLLPASGSVLCKRAYFKPMGDDGRGETAAEGSGITLYDSKGLRTPLKAVELRFKRLDWGMWIRPKAGRNKKAWKKHTRQLQNREKHFFCAPYHNSRFDRAVLSEIKEIRHIPDDPYKVYNDISYQNHQSIRRKNSELVLKYGSQIYNFPWYRSHYKKQILASDKNDNHVYEPPGYQKDIADGNGVFVPTERSYDIPAPSYVLEQRGESKIARMEERRYWKAVRLGERYTGFISQCHPLKLPVYGTKLG